MQLYTAHWRGTDRRLVLVREGFCWWAALFPLIWVVWHRMWRALLALIALEVAAWTVATLLDFGMCENAVLRVGIFLLIGFEASDWRRRNLERRGFEAEVPVCGASRDVAEWRWFEDARQRGMAI